MTRCFALHLPCIFSPPSTSEPMSPCSSSSASSSTTSLPITPPNYCPRSPLTGPSHFMSRRRRRSYASSSAFSSPSPAHSPHCATPSEAGSSSSDEALTDEEYRSRQGSTSSGDFDALPSHINHFAQLDQTVASFVDQTRSRVPHLKRSLDCFHGQSTAYGLGISGVGTLCAAPAKQWGENEEHPWYPGIPIRQHSQWHTFATTSPCGATSPAVACIPLSRELPRVRSWSEDTEAPTHDVDDVKLPTNAQSPHHDNDDDDDEDEDVDEKEDLRRSTLPVPPTTTTAGATTAAVAPISTMPTKSPTATAAKSKPKRTIPQPAASAGLTAWWRSKHSPHLTSDRSDRR